MKEYEEAARLIAAHPELSSFAGRRPDALVGAAEERLAVRFPATYRRFVLEFGAGNFGGAEIYGVTGENFDSGSVPNGVWYTLTERAAGLPADLTVVYGDGMGNLGCIRCPNEPGNEAQVILYEPGVPSDQQRQELLAPDFGLFFLALIKGEL
jgi:SUKH superfamily protein